MESKKVYKDIDRSQSAALFERSKECFPGGVNSPVRAFKSVYGTPLFIERGDGCHIWDADGNEFIDFCGSWGPLILGHNNAYVRNSVAEAMQHGLSFGAPTRLENELAELILKNHVGLGKIRFTSSGTEAVMSAVRLARGYTGRDKILKFEGCYHGHSDSLLVKAGSGLVTFGETSSKGVPEAFARETIVVPLNNIGAVEEAFKQFKGEIAAVIIEGVPANNGLLIQTAEYMGELRELCTKEGTLLILDEVITGFRLGFEGAAGHYGIKPDIITYGKIIGGGLPVGMYGASNEIMAQISPDGPVYQAGTLSGNPVAMAAGMAQLSQLLAEGFYTTLEAKANSFLDPIKQHIKHNKYPVLVVNIASIFWLAFTDKPQILCAEDIEPASMEKFKVLHRELLNRGVYLGPSGYEVGFINAAHTDADLETAANYMCEALDLVFS